MQTNTCIANATKVLWLNIGFFPVTNNCLYLWWDSPDRLKSKWCPEESAIARTGYFVSCLSLLQAAITQLLSTFLVNIQHWSSLDGVKILQRLPLVK